MRAVPVTGLLVLAGCSFLVDPGGNVQPDAAPDAPVDAAAECPEGQVFRVDGTCVDCVESSHCASKVCDKRGYTCVPENEVIYVTLDGVNNGSLGDGCTLAEPCATENRALNALSYDRNWIFFGEGVHPISRITADGDEKAYEINLYGEPGAILTSNADGEPTLSVIDQGKLRVLGLTVVGSTIDNSDQHGIRCTDSTLEVMDSVLRDNEGIGVHLVRCTAKILASRVAGNQLGGVQAWLSNLDLISSILDNNGRPSSYIGAVRLRNCEIQTTPTENCETMPLSIRLLFNTIADNFGRDDGSAGVRCDDLHVPIVARGNLVQENSAQYNVQVTGPGNASENCTFTDSVAPPMWPDPVGATFANGEYELAAESFGLDVPELDDIADEILWDYSGGPRVVGDHPDMGAQERD